MNSQQSKQKQTVWRWVIVVLCSAAVIAVCVAAYMQFFGEKNTQVNSFVSCKEANGRITEDNPSKCEIDGKQFTDGQRGVDDSDIAKPDESTGKSATDAEIREAYIGLSEEDAIARAESEDRPVRVVARDDEQINSTTDLRDGRLNLTIKDGKVASVEVERIELSQ